MQPNSPPPAPPPVQPTGHNPYAFIYEDRNKSKNKLFSGGNSSKQRILIVIIGLILFLFVGAVILAVLKSGGENNKAELVNVVEKQTEIIRIANIGATKATDATVKNYALTTSLSVQSSNNQLLGVMKKNGQVVTKKELATSKNSATDVLLKNAEQNNSFDAAFNKELISELGEYKASLKKALDSSSNDKTKAILGDSSTQAYIILGPAEKTN